MGAPLRRFRQKRDPLLRVFAHVRFERRRLGVKAKMLQQISEALRPGDTRRPGGNRKFLRIEPLGEFREDRRHLIETAGTTGVTD